jgi:hypothetical protein
MNTQPTDRELTIQGMRDLADFLDAHPDVPIARTPILYFHVDNNRAIDRRDRRAEVDRIAALIGVKPRDDGPHYGATRAFGNVTFKAVSCDPGPKPGLCVVCRTSSVHRAGSELIDGRVCTACLTPSIAAAFDVAHELTDGPADTAKES